MATAFLADVAHQATTRLNEADTVLDYHCNRIRALSHALQALLPAEIHTHPVVGAQAIKPNASRPTQEEVCSLRDALIACRELVGLVDDAASAMSDQVAEGMLRARRAIGLPDPEWTTRAEQPEGGQHAC